MRQHSLKETGYTVHSITGKYGCSGKRTGSEGTQLTSFLRVHAHLPTGWPRRPSRASLLPQSALEPGRGPERRSGRVPVLTLAPFNSRNSTTQGACP